ncbi:MAG: DeoR/GlpR family DNA-binding transcription regulator [Luteolibacter sp.]
MKSFSSSERHRDLVGIVRREGRISMAQLISESSASPATIRRDINQLVADGTLRRVRGGVFWPENQPIETPHERRLGDARDQKLAIAREAAQLVPPNASVFIDSGTTCAAVAEALCSISGLTIYTSSLALAEFVQRAACRIVFVGGECRSVSLALVGSVTEEQVGRLRPDIAFVGATGVHPKDGLFTTDPNEAGVKARAVEHASRVVLVADSSKAGQTSSVLFAEWKRVETWITDNGLSRRESAKYPTKVVRAS